MQKITVIYLKISLFLVKLMGLTYYFKRTYFEFCSFVHFVNHLSRSFSSSPVEIMTLNEYRMLRHATKENIALS